MSKRIKYILALFVCILYLLACNTVKIPTEYRFKPNEVNKTNTGCWIDIKIRGLTNSEPEVKLSGELIAIQADTIFILTDLQLNGIPSSGVNEAVLYVFNNQGGHFFLATA
jgi:hypothetical protein